MYRFFGTAKRAAEEAEAQRALKRAKLCANLDSESRLNASRDSLISLMVLPPAENTRRTNYAESASPKLVSPPGSVSHPTADYTILSKILEQFDDPADLKAAINSSPAFLAAFQSSRAKVLKSVLTNAIHPTALNATLGLYHCPRFVSGDEKEMLPPRSPRLPSPSSPSSPRARASKWQYKVDKFLRKFKEQTLEMPTEYEDLVFLCRIYNRNASIIPAFAASILSHGATPQLMDPTARRSLAEHNLTPREVGRLQRAFCHYVIYCALLDPRAAHAGADLKDVNLSLTRCEAEELQHVRAFVRDQYYQVFGQLEEEFTKYLLKHMRKDKAQSDVPRYTAAQLVAENWESFPYLEHFFKHYDHETDEKIRPQSTMNYVSFLVDMGPDFLRNFLRMSAKTRFEFILQTMYPILSLRRQPVDLRDSTAPAISKDPQRLPNAAWKIIVQATRKGAVNTSSSQREGLRRFGWVFWDGFRLKQMELDTAQRMLKAANAKQVVACRAKRAADVPGLVKAKFRRLFWSRRVKKDWAANECVSGREQNLILGWLGQIRAKAPMSVDQWMVDLKMRQEK